MMREGKILVDDGNERSLGSVVKDMMTENV
jgi:hypothetical protein